MAKIGINLKEGKIEKRKPSFVIGIDLGTTNSLVAVVQDGESEVLRNNEGDSRLVPSVIHFDKEQNPTTGETAKRSLIDDPSNTIFSVKRLMGKSYKDIAGLGLKTSYKIIDNDTDDLVRVAIQGRHYSPIELSAIILKSLKERAEKALNGEVNQAVITVPAYFNDGQRQATRDAGKLAGLDVLRIVNEPTAAALAYGIGQDSADEEIIAVYDLGGGTFDISILQISQGVFEVLSTHGDTALGGDDLDEAIVQYWCNKHPQLDKSNPNLRWLAERAKIEMTSKNIVEYTLKDVALSLDHASLKTIVQPFIDKTIIACQKALKDANMTTSQIDKVVLVGGSTRLDLVKSAVKGFFQLEPYDKINPDEIVAKGAAIQADILAGNRNDILLLDITPLSLGIETLGGLMDVIIPRNTGVPIKAAREYTTSVDGQANLKVSVYQGEREMIEDNRKLGEFILKGIPSMAAGIPKIEIAFIIDANGILQVRATEKRSNTQQEVQIKSQYGISEIEMAQMLKDSLTHASEDMQKRSLREAEIDAQLLLKSMDTFKKKNSDIVQGHVTEISSLEEKLRVTLESNDKDVILQAIDELNEFTKPLAEKAMDRAISTAMKGKKI